jgi:hypothetical protein
MQKGWQQHPAAAAGKPQDQRAAVAVAVAAVTLGGHDSSRSGGRLVGRRQRLLPTSSGICQHGRKQRGEGRVCVSLKKCGEINKNI